MSYPNWKQLSFLFLCLTVGGDLMAAATVVDSRFKPALDPVPATATAWMAPDGKLVLTGNFDHINKRPLRRFTRLNADGSIDRGFSNLIGSRGWPDPVAFTPDGGIIARGYIVVTNVGYPLFRLRNNGTFDSSFKPDSSVHRPGLIAVQPDGKVLAYATEFANSFPTYSAIQRLNTNGTIDKTFSANVSNMWVRVIVPQPDGKLLLRVTTFFPSTNHPPQLIRLNSDGSRDGSFYYSKSVDAMVPLPGGQLAILRREEEQNWNTLVERLLPDGTVDATFHCEPFSPILTECLAAQSDGKIIIGGMHFCARLNANGSFDTTFMAPSDIDWIKKIYVTPDDKIILNGWLNDPSVGRLSLLQLNPDGTRDQTFAPKIEGPAQPSFVRGLSSGKILIAGQITTVEGLPSHSLARLHGSGALDRTFQPGLPYVLTAAPAYSDSSVVLFNDRGDTLFLTSRPLAVRPDGAVRSNIGPYPMALEPDGSILGMTFASMYRIGADGNYDPEIGRNYSATVPAINVSGITTGKNGRIYVTGWDVSGFPRGVRLNHNGTIDPSFNGPANWYATQCERGDGKVYVRLSPPNDPGLPLYRLNANGTIDPTFKPIRENFSDAIVDRRGRLYICDAFQFVGNQWVASPSGQYDSVIRLLEDGSVDNTFHVYTDSTVTSMSFLPDGRLVIAGTFKQVNGMPRKNIACVFPDGKDTLPLEKLTN